MDWRDWRYRPRSRLVGSAGMIGALAGGAAAGQLMIWCGWFRPGETPNEQILNYWPGFLTGAAVGGFALSFVARLFWSAFRE